MIRERSEALQENIPVMLSFLYESDSPQAEKVANRKYGGWNDDLN